MAARLVLQGLQQAQELRLRLLLPVDLYQSVNQCVLLLVEQEAVGQVQVQRVACVDRAGGQPQEQAEPARQSGEEPAAADIREQADIHLGHAQPAAGGDDADAGTLHQAHTAAQHMAVGPADQRLGIGVDAVIQAVFVGEEALGQFRHGARCLAALLHQLHHVAAGAEGLGPGAAQQHAGNGRVLGPAFEVGVERLDHRQAQGVEAFLGVEGGHADARAVGSDEFLEMHVHHLFRFIYCATGDHASRGRR